MEWLRLSFSHCGEPAYCMAKANHHSIRKYVLYAFLELRNESSWLSNGVFLCKMLIWHVKCTSIIEKSCPKFVGPLQNRNGENILHALKFAAQWGKKMGGNFEF